MGTGYSLLYRRQGIYRFRRVVPKELREIIGLREIKVSLRTSDPDEAKRRAAREAIKADQRIAEARRVLTNPAARAQRLVQEHENIHRRRPRTAEELEDEAVVIEEALEKETDPVRVRALRAILKKLNAPDDDSSHGRESHAVHRLRPLARRTSATSAYVDGVDQGARAIRAGSGW